MSAHIAHSGAWGLAIVMVVIASWVFYRDFAPQGRRDGVGAGVGPGAHHRPVRGNVRRSAHDLSSRAVLSSRPRWLERELVVDAARHGRYRDDNFQADRVPGALFRHRTVHRGMASALPSAPDGQTRVRGTLRSRAPPSVRAACRGALRLGRRSLAARFHRDTISNHRVHLHCARVPGRAGHAREIRRPIRAVSAACAHVPPGTWRLAPAHRASQGFSGSRCRGITQARRLK